MKKNNGILEQEKNLITSALKNLLMLIEKVNIGEYDRVQMRCHVHTVVTILQLNRIINMKDVRTISEVYEQGELFEQFAKEKKVQINDDLKKYLLEFFK